jgi:hypothetical protein
MHGWKTVAVINGVKEVAPWLSLMDEGVTDGAAVTRQSKRMATLAEGERKNAMASGRLLKTINSDYGNGYYHWKGVVRHGYPGVPTDQAHGRPRQVGPV